MLTLISMDDIHRLVKDGAIEHISALVSRDKTCVNSLEGGWTPLGIACQLGRADVVDVLVHAGVDVNRPVNGSWTPLYVACMEGHLEVMLCLLKGMFNNTTEAILFFAFALI